LDLWGFTYPECQSRLKNCVIDNKETRHVFSPVHIFDGMNVILTRNMLVSARRAVHVHEDVRLRQFSERACTHYMLSLC
jgi:hypothetical protein